jgi:hypothetical protein
MVELAGRPVKTRRVITSATGEQQMLSLARPDNSDAGAMTCVSLRTLGAVASRSRLGRAAAPSRSGDEPVSGLPARA